MDLGCPECGGRGVKYDDGKKNWLLLTKALANELEQIVDVLEYGAKKYDDDNWKYVGLEDLTRTRYWKAFWRHLMEIMKGNEIDEDSGFPHLDMCVTNLLFVMNIRNEDGRKNDL